MDSILPHYTHHINPKLKHTYLSFDDEGGLVIRSPKVSHAYIETLLIKKSAWIQRAQQRIKQKKGRTPALIDGAHLYYLGTPYPLSLSFHTHRRTLISFDKEVFLLRYHTFDRDLLYQHIDNFYKQKAEDFISSRVEVWAQKMNLSYGKIRFQKTKRQWGSCSSQNNLSFNTMLMKLPQETIDYVIVHELAHIVYKHHQKSFWQLVGKILPEYREQIAQLRTFTPF
jgi:predicted metal-dependent hydrolase